MHYNDNNYPINTYTSFNKGNDWFNHSVEKSIGKNILDCSPQILNSGFRMRNNLLNSTLRTSKF